MLKALLLAITLTASATSLQVKKEKVPKIIERWKGRRLTVAFYKEVARACGATATMQKEIVWGSSLPEWYEDCLQKLNIVVLKK